MRESHKTQVVRVIVHVIAQCFYDLISWAFRRFIIPLVEVALV